MKLRGRGMDPPPKALLTGVPIETQVETVSRCLHRSAPAPRDLLGHQAQLHSASEATRDREPRHDELRGHPRLPSPVTIFH